MEGQLASVLREKLLAAVASAPPPLTRRDARLPRLRNKAFAVIGMRRAGKTFFLHQCRTDLLAAGARPEQLVHFSFEDERLGDMKLGDLSLIPEIHTRLFPEQGQPPVTYFFDEIQRVPGWEVFARRLLDTPGHGLFVSGSSAKLLSREIATAMRGRAWEVLIHPFSFRETLRHHGSETPTNPLRIAGRQAVLLDRQLVTYLEGGGFPEAQELDLSERHQLLQGYVDAVLLRDVIERHGVAHPVVLRWMVRRLLGSPAASFSVHRFFGDIRSQGLAVGRETLHEYFGYLADSFLLHTVPLATDSEKRRQVNPRKAYPADPGLIQAFDRSGRPNIGHALETAVLIELLRRGHEVAYVKTADGHEVDFLARAPGGGQSLIQACASLDDPATLAREIRALRAAKKEHSRASPWLVVLESRSRDPEVPKPIRIVPAWRWMLGLET